jgi:predicted DNA-binding transcriptional regulator YafY
VRADRLIALLLILQNRGKRSCRALAEELEVSRRTILRDVDALSSAGIPVMAEGGHGGGIWLDEAYRTSLTGFSEAELRALLIGGDAALSGDLGLGEAFSRGRLKLLASLPRRYEEVLVSVRQRILVDSRWWWNEEGASDFLRPLQEAVLENAVLEAEYEHYDGSIGRGRIEAYGLVAKAGLWYFVGRREGEHRSYRVSRFRSISDTGERFTRDPSFDLGEWWSRSAERFAREFSAYRFVIALPEERLRFVRWIAPGRVEVRGPHVPRKGWMEAEIGLDSALYAELLVLGLDSECRVLEPRALADAVVSRARAAIEVHARPVSGRKGPASGEASSP